MERRLAAVLAADVVGYSRLMRADEAGTLRRLTALRESILAPLVAGHRGRIVKLLGDGLLVEFSSVVDAVGCAIAWQAAVAQHEAGQPDDTCLLFRIGVNLGDVIVEGDDIHGDGVNIAARLEGLAEPGGICLSGDTYRQVRGKVDAGFDDLGERTLKNIDEPMQVYRVRPDAERPSPETSGSAAPELQQDIRFCTAPDGVRIGYATVGSGPAIVKTANFLTHLEYDWQSPVWLHMLRALCRDHLLVRYDERGNGLSDWDAEDLSFEAWVQDLESVVDAAGLKRFTLFGVSQGCAVSIAYAVRHPDRVNSLILYGGFAVGIDKRGAESVELQRTYLSLVKQGWGQDNPAFRQAFTSLFIPEGTAEQMQWLNDLQRITTSPENAVRLMETMAKIDVRALLPRVTVPTLVLHIRDDAIVPFELGREMAVSIPEARFVPLEGRNHFILEHEAAWPKFMAEVTRFLEADVQHGNNAPG